MTFDSTPGFAGFRGGQTGEAYNEAAFRHLLAVDRARTERSHRCVFLVLVTVQKSPGRAASLSPATAAAVLGGLDAAVREVDFVGWYKDGRVAAAVLAQGTNTPDRRVSALIAARTRTELVRRLTLDEAERLRIRVIRLGDRPHL